jgi:hypothetical protein
MNFRLQVLSFLVLCVIPLSYCNSDRFYLDTEDILIESRNDDSLGAFRLISTTDTRPVDFKWLGLAKARLVNINSNTNSSSSSFFKFVHGGFLANIDFSLSEKIREMLAARAREIYSSPEIQKSQILDMQLTNLTCKLDYSKSTIAANILRPLSRMPIVVYFPTFFFNKKERKTIKQLGNDGALKCELEVNHQLALRFSLAIKQNQMFTSDEDETFNQKEKLKLQVERLKQKFKGDLFFI